MAYKLNPITGKMDYYLPNNAIDHSALLNLTYALAGHIGFEPTLTKGNLTTTTTGLAITGGTGVVIGLGATINADTGYGMPTTAKMSNWDIAYSWGDHSGLYLKLDQTTPQTIINGVPLMTAPVDEYGSGNQLVNKDYCDSAHWLMPPIIEWYDPVAEGGLPPLPDVGDRYGADDTGYGWTEGYIYEWDGDSWVESEPEEGWMLWDLLEMILWFFFSGGWEEVGYDSYWSMWDDQIGLTGDKTGTFDLTTTGIGTFNSVKIPQIGGTAGKFSIFQGGANTADLTYTLPIAYPVTLSGNLRSTTAGILSWDESVYLTSVTAHNLLSAIHGDTVSASPVLGDILYGDATPNWTKLAGNTTTTKKFLTQTGTGAISAIPAWDTLIDGDIPSALTGKTYNGLSLTANADGFEIAGGTTSRIAKFTGADITFTGSGTNIYTFPGATCTLASLDQVEVFTNKSSYNGLIITANTGVITTGTWNATLIAGQYGGTGVANTGKTITLGGNLITSGAYALTLTLSNTTGVTLPTAGTLSTLAGVETFTNKRINSRFTTATSYTTSTTIDSDANDQYIITAQAGNLLFNNPSGTPVDGQKLIIAVTGTAARALTYGNAFEASTVALPTTTVTTARLNIGFIWRADTSKWVCVAVS